MSKKTLVVALLLVAESLFILNSCTKNTTVTLDNSPAITTPVSFSKDIAPILTSKCATTGCHSGTVAPNLSVVTAYSSLKGGNYINTGVPKSSEVYLWLTGKRAVAMPAGSANNPSNINALMLAWITQGAKDN